MTDARCTRVGTQCWVFGAIMFTEMIICIKFGKDIFEHTQILTIALWLAIQSGMSMLCLYGCVLYHRRDGKVVDFALLYLFTKVSSNLCSDEGKRGSSQN